MGNDDDDSIVEGTRIDLAEDLLQTDSGLDSFEALDKKQIDLDDSVKSAEILISEGLVEEAKRTLWRILRKDPNHVLARKMLEDIHESELRLLFSESPTRKRDKKSNAPEIEREIGIDALIQQVDRDLGLGLDETGSVLIKQLFGDPKDIQTFIDRLKHELVTLAPAEKIDVGIAYLQMGLFQVAAALFETVQKNPADTSLGFTAVCLHAQARLAMNEPYEALHILESFLGSSDLTEDQKLNLYYLLGRAHEKNGNPAAARSCYEWIFKIREDYRDIKERIKL